MVQVLHTGAATLFAVKVRGHPLVCLWDTGANVSLVSLPLLKRLKLDHKIDTSGRKILVKGVSAGLVPTLGQVEVPLCFDDQVVRPVLCLVCESVPHDLLIGTPFMYGNRLSFDPGMAPHDMTLKDKVGRVVARPPLDAVSSKDCLTVFSKSFVKRRRPQSKTESDGYSLKFKHNKVPPLDPLFQSAFGAKLKSDDPFVLVATLLREKCCNLDFTAREQLQSFATSAHDPDSTAAVLGTEARVAGSETKLPTPDDDQWELQPEIQKALDDLVQEFDDIFAVDNSDVGKAARDDVVIKLTTNAPVVQRNYRTPLKFRDWLKQELKDLMKAGIIEISESQYNSPALVVPKKLDEHAAASDVTASKGMRLVVDYRQLNKVIEDANFPIPRVQDLVTQYKGKDVFSTMDIRHAYYTIRLDKESRKVTAFSCEFGKFQFCFLPQGLKISPAIFQQTITNVLANLDHSDAYMDDINTATCGQVSHLHALRDVFQAMRKSRFKLKKAKSRFMCKKIVSVGWQLSSEGVAIAPDKLKDVEKLRPPHTVGEVRSLMGFVNFLREHVPHFADIVAPIQDLIRLGKGQSNTNIDKFWTPVCDKSLDILKSELLSNKILAYPDSSIPFELYTDASGRHMSGVLMQRGRPIGYFAKSFKGTEANWAALVKEAHAVYRAVEFFSVFVTGAKVLLKCDHQPLQQFLHASTKNAMVNRWSLNLQQYDIEFEWVATDKNISDCLSRLLEEGVYTPHEPVQAEFPSKGQVVVQACSLKIQASDVSGPLSGHDMVALQRKDAYCVRVRRLLGTDHKLADQFHFDHDILYRIVSKKGSLHLALVLPRVLILTAVVNTHLELLHPGQDKQLAVLQEKVYWKGMQKTVARYIAGCRECQLKTLKKHSYSYLHDDPPSTPFSKLAVDFVSGYGKTKRGNVAVLTAIDTHSQYPFAIPTPDKTAASAVSAFTEILATANSCQTVLSDNGPEFTSDAFQQLLVSHSIKHITSAPYCPQSNGVLERWHRYLNTVVRLCGMHRQNNAWEDAVVAALKAYRVMPHTSSGLSPHFVCFGKDPRLCLDSFLPILRRNFSDPKQVNRAFEHLRVAFGLARKNLCIARSRQSNPKVREPTRPLAVGDLVTVRQNAATKGQSQWKDGYRILKFISARQVQVEHMETSHKIRVGLQHLVRTEPMAVLLDNSRLDVFPGRTKLYLPAQKLPDLKWPDIDSGIDLEHATLEKILEAARDRENDVDAQASPGSEASNTHPRSDASVDAPSVPPASVSKPSSVPRTRVRLNRTERRKKRAERREQLPTTSSQTVNPVSQDSVWSCSQTSPL